MARSLRPLEVFPITTRTLEVLRVADVTPGMRRVTLGGPELAAFTAGNGYPVADFRSDGFDDEFKILLKHPEVERAIGPTQNDGILDWPRDPLMVLRTYTVRRWDPEAGELDVDFVQHGVGPATAWSRHVAPGERIQIAGPKMSSGHPEGADWCLIAGDETALPSIGRWLEEFPAGGRAQVFVEVAEDDHRQELAVPDGVELTWLVRHSADPGCTTLLFDAVTAAPWWEGTVFAWVSGEAVTLAPIRRWLRHEKGLPNEQVEATGYWRRTAVVVREDDPEQPDLEASGDEADTIHELADVVPAFALRAAVTVGLPRALSAGPLDTAALARSTGTSPLGLGKLVRYLAALGVLEPAGDGRWALTRMGRVLDDEYVEERLDLDGPAARRELGLLALAGALRTGRTDYATWFGGGYEELVQRDPAALRGRVHAQADDAAYVAGALAAHPVFGEITDLVVAGGGAHEFARALVGNHGSLTVRVAAPPAEVDLLRSGSGGHERVRVVPGGTLDLPPGVVDAVLLADALGGHPDEEAVAALRLAADRTRPGGRVLVSGELLDPALADEHEFEADLVEFSLTGGSLRDAAEHEALFAAAGLRVADRSTVGWGYTVYQLVDANDRQ